MNWTFPNLLSLARLGLIPLFVISLLQGNSKRALVVFVAAGVTDALDGLSARFLKQESVLGAYLDPIADKLLLTTAFVMLTIPGLNSGVTIPMWVTVLVITRDVLILVISLVLFLALDISKFKPLALSRWNTAVQVVTVGLVLLSGFVDRADTLTYVGIYLVAALTITTGLYYLVHLNKILGRHANETA